MKIALGIILALALLAAGCGGSTVNVSERMSADMGTDVNCSEAGFDEAAGERERVYSCAFAIGHVKSYACVAVVEGGIYVVRPRQC